MGKSEISDFQTAQEPGERAKSEKNFWHAGITNWLDSHFHLEPGCRGYFMMHEGRRKKKKVSAHFSSPRVKCVHFRKFDKINGEKYSACLLREKLLSFSPLILL